MARNCRSVICMVYCFVKIGEYHRPIWVEKSVGVLFCGLAYFSDFRIEFLCLKVSEISAGNKL